MNAVALERLVWAVAAAVVVSVGLAASPLPRRFMGESGVQAPEAPERASEAAPVALDPILALMPFGRNAEPDEPAEETEDTALGLALHGVVTSAASAGSSAIVSGEGQPARAYALGQELPGGATLVEVQGDHVVIETDGRRETLSFPERRRDDLATDGDGDEDSTGDEAVEEDSDDAPPAATGVDALRALVVGQAQEAQEEEPAESEAPDPEAEIASWRERVQTEPDAVLDELGLTAGEEGYAVGDEASDLMRRAGLLPGDVVAKVNGQQVGNIDDDQPLFDEIVAAGRARLEIIREGETVVMSFPLR